jgi:hypothetical protein
MLLVGWMKIFELGALKLKLYARYVPQNSAEQAKSVTLDCARFSRGLRAFINVLQRTESPPAPKIAPFKCNAPI